ncbi:uncharacterized protein LOC107268428 isoform X2 [Cephus cinctus]|uniref:Uncharacterized protein LOC107268428 isoform X2 n=1 Tax=Cephus cinctus TaxID=211228 RepID=A0AAJ7FKT3_CEPCN|nr:uncharacterized protein LOC107268428 isoform X2 [Cephus cinctus]
MFNEFRHLLVVSFPSSRHQIPKTTSLVRSSSAPSISLSSEQLYVSSVPVTPSSQKVSRGVPRSSPSVNKEDDELWNVLDTIRNKGTNMLARINVDNVDATRTERKYIVEEEVDVTKLQREKVESFNRIQKLEKDATTSHKLVKKLKKQFDELTKIRNELQEHLLDESASRLHKAEPACDSAFIELLPTAGNNTDLPCESITVAAIVSEIIDRIKFRNNTTDKTVATQVEPADFQLGPDETSVKIQRGQLGLLDDALAFPKEVIKVEDIDRAKILTILEQRSHVVLQRHLIIAIVRNQIYEKKLDQIQTNYNYLMTRFNHLSQMNSNLCKESIEQLKELHSARLRIMELMQLVPLTELEVEMQNEEKNKKSIPTMLSTSLSGRREISQPVPVPGVYTPPRQVTPGTKGSSRFMSRSYVQPHSSYSSTKSHDTGTRESLNKSLLERRKESSRSFEKITRTQDPLTKRLGNSSRDTGNRYLKNTRHSIETKRYGTRPGPSISTGPSHYRSDYPDPIATGTAPNETSTRRKLFSWSNLLK